MSVADYFKRAERAVLSISDGLAVTFSHLFRKPITIQYPDRIKFPVTEMEAERFRGILEVDLAICTGCLLCMRACPIKVILIEIIRDLETKERFIKRFDIDVSKCMFCGLCTEVCPTETLVHTKEFEADKEEIKDLILQFIPPGQKVPLYKIKKDEPAIRAAKGSILKKILGKAKVLDKKKGFNDESALAKLKEQLAEKPLPDAILLILGDTDFSHFGYTNNQELARALTEGREFLGLLEDFGLGGRFLKQALKQVLSASG